MRNQFCLILSAFVVFFSGCSGDPERPPAIGEAYVGPARLDLRREIALKSGVTASVKHGERLDIVRTRRSFVLVRTEGGVEGWTHTRDLLTPDEIDRLKQMEDEARTMPSQGVASTYELLNVHTAPERRAPSFLQVNEGDKLEVLAHRVVPRSTGPVARRNLVEAPAPARKAARKPKKPERYPKPPLPSAPKPPENWLQLSERPAGLEPEPEEEVKPVPKDDWYLVRTPSGRSGWVLTRRVYMAIPDEVAQYAEGRRITSYFSLGTVQDGDQTRHHWLWTTIERGLEPYQFDGFRVFIWNLRRHRYETAYRERNLKGYYPVRIQTVELPVTVRKGEPPQSVKYPGFSLLVEKPEGTRYWRSYAFIGNIVRFAGESPAEDIPRPSDSGGSLVASADSNRNGESSITDRLMRRVKRLFGH